MSSSRLPDEPAERVEALLEEVVDALDLDAEVVVEERDDQIPAGSRARTSAC